MAWPIGTPRSSETREKLSVAVAAAKPPRDLAKRFWEKVDRGPSCWIWTGSLNRDGYGRLITGSRADGSRSVVLAHRMAYTLTVGEIPVGKNVLHSCDTPGCVNPAHLRIGTPKDNARDRSERGRHRST